MSDQNNENGIAFDLPKNQSAVIKVIGVGGGGSNAVNHMYHAGIRGVDFVICNTDAQALEFSPVPNKIQLGTMLTEGLGAGADPEMGRQAAIENIEEVRAILERNTKMVFITAGMGGGTGTGAAPVVAGLAKDLGILTVGIVTMPFEFEGKARLKQAMEGVSELRDCVDSLIVINNNKLREVYGNLGFRAGFSKADEVLATAAKGIAEVITHHYTTNIDLRDARTVLQNSGTAIMGASRASGPDRAEKAIRQALDSPLLNDNQIRGAKNVLLLIVSGTNEEEITIDEIGEINDHIQNEAGGNANIIMGIGEDNTLEGAISVTIIATGFSSEQQNQVVRNEPPERIIMRLEDESPKHPKVLSASVQPEAPVNNTSSQSVVPPPAPKALTVEPSKDEEAPKMVVFSDTIEEVSRDTYDADEDDVRFVLIDDEEIDEAPETLTTETPELTTVASTFAFEMEALDEQEPEMMTDAPEETTPQEVSVPQSEKKVFMLEDIEAFERSLNIRKPLDEVRKQQDVKKAEESTDEALNFSVRVTNTPSKEAVESVEASASPMDTPISQALKDHSRMTREHLLRFNYSFKNLPNGLREIEKVPAYKRQGIEVGSGSYSSDEALGSMTVSGNGKEVSIKTNNSFLHDNVD
jgi:cell division protein FtsZ